MAFKFRSFDSDDDEWLELPNLDIASDILNEKLPVEESPQDASTQSVKNTESQTKAVGVSKAAESNGKSRKQSIVILDDDEVEEFQIKQLAQNTVKESECAVRRLQSWYRERYREDLVCQVLPKSVQAIY